MFRRYLLIILLSAACVSAYAQAAVGYSSGFEGVRRYLEEVGYSEDPDYRVSHIIDYKKDFPAVDILSGESLSVIGNVRIIGGVAENMRDLGGWEADGGHIAYGKLYRGAKLERITGGGKDIFLDRLGISVDLDLRGSVPGDSRTGPVIEGVEYLRLPVDRYLGRGTGRTEELYQLAIRCIIGWLGEGRAVYFHCSAGADRTGTLAFLIEALLGVSESDLSKDYELTTFFGRHTRRRNTRAGLFQSCVLYEMVSYLRRYGYPQVQSINQLVLNWATTRHSDVVDPLTLEEIALLRSYLVERD